MKTLELSDYTYTIGTNAVENDALITRSGLTDTWFHLDELPSCHGVINCPIDTLTSNLVYKCALNIKLNTKFKKTPRLKIIYTEISNIIKTDIMGQVILLKTPKSVCV